MKALGWALPYWKSFALWVTRSRLPIAVLPPAFFVLVYISHDMFYQSFGVTLHEVGLDFEDLVLRTGSWLLIPAVLLGILLVLTALMLVVFFALMIRELRIVRDVLAMSTRTLLVLLTGVGLAMLRGLGITSAETATKWSTWLVGIVALSWLFDNATNRGRGRKKKPTGKRKNLKTSTEGILASNNSGVKVPWAVILLVLAPVVFILLISAMDTHLITPSVRHAMSGKPVGLAPFLSIRAYPVTLTWLSGESPPLLDTSRTLLYLGESEATYVLFDPSNALTLRIPKERVLLQLDVRQ